MQNAWVFLHVIKFSPISSFIEFTGFLPLIVGIPRFLYGHEFNAKNSIVLGLAWIPGKSQVWHHYQTGMKVVNYCSTRAASTHVC
jgi:hypothetical protein